MTRWTILAIAFAVAACSEGGRDRVSSGASDAAAGADTGLRADPDPTGTARRADSDTTETAAAGGADTKGAMAADTAAAPGPGAGGTRGPTGAEAMGGIRNPTTRRDLSADQVRRLQAALNDAGCNAGAVDGVVGRRTRQAVACGLEKNNLGSDDLSGLYRALDLDF